MKTKKINQQRMYEEYNKDIERETESLFFFAFKILPILVINIIVQTSVLFYVARPIE